ncbi:MAG: hypothetical protein HRU70_09905 [Phycisphaeraceae bacterium]|nr:MAG: hypothetical protein HRU70_09905 [Phycisphaeraceae bacterium]
MKKIVAGLVAVAGLASGASAQSAFMDLKVWDGSAWVNDVAVLPGTVVQAAMFIGFSEGYGLSGAVYQIRGFGGVAGDGVDIASAGLGRQAPFNFGAATQAVFGDGTNWRIDASSDAANSRNAGIATAQNSPPNLGVGFNTDNPALVYRFDIVVSADGTIRSIQLEAPLSELKGATSTAPGVIGVYTSNQASRGTNYSDVTTDGATIRVVPTPGALALLGLGGLVAGRRRR